MSAPWIDQIKAVGAQAVAVGVGMTTGRQRTLGPCPACKASQRGGADKRAPIGVGKDGCGWKCFACGAHGDPLDLVALSERGVRSDQLDEEGWRVVRTRCAELGWIGADDHAGASRTVSVSKLVGGLLGRRGDRAARMAGAQRATASSGATEGQEEHGGGGGGRFTWRDDLAESCAAALWSPAGAPALAYLRDVRRLSEDAIREHGLGVHEVVEAGVVVERWITIPLRDPAGEVVNVRFRSVAGPCLRCAGKGCDSCKDGQVAKAYRVCVGRDLPLFGADHLKDDLGASVVVVEGELDVIALWSYGYTANVVSGTAGAGTFGTRQDWLDQLEPYASFVLAYDDDEAGDAGAEELATKLGRERCSRVRWNGAKDVGELLANGVDVEVVAKALKGAESMIKVKIRSVDSFADELETLIDHPEDLVGTSTGSAKLTKCLGGWRPGLVILSAETGSGKSTLATWFCLEQARIGIPALLTSFEQRPIGTVQKLLRAQLGNDPLKATREERAAGLAALGALPLSIVDHRGHIPPADLLDTIRYARRRHDVRFVLIDHLGFCLDPDAEDERREIEVFVRALSIFAEFERLTIVLVVHPSNTYIVQKRRVGIGDLKGASAIRQDAHDILIVERLVTTKERPWPAAMVHLDKVRSEYGQPGSRVLLAYDPLACTYADSWGETPAGRRGVVPVAPEEPARRRRPAESAEPRQPRESKEPKSKKLRKGKDAAAGDETTGGGYTEGDGDERDGADA